LTNPNSFNELGNKESFSLVSPIWQLIASVFVKYRVKRCVFHYMPQSAATEEGRMVFAFAADAVHPLIWRKQMRSQELLALGDSVAFMAWKSWSMDVSHRLADTEYYTYAFPEEGAGAGSFVERLNDFGVLGCVTSGVLGSGTVPKKAGVLYMETVVEFDEFCPITNDRLEQPTPVGPIEKYMAATVNTVSNSITTFVEDLDTAGIVGEVVGSTLKLLLPDGVWEWSAPLLQSMVSSTVDTVAASTLGWAISNGSQYLDIAGQSTTATREIPLQLKYLGPSDSGLAAGLRTHFKKVRDDTAAQAGFVKI
jgi:hypothetical protein